MTIAKRALWSAVCGALAVTASLTPRAQEPGTSVPLVSADQYERWQTELSNWGRWGPDDELGAANLITGVADANMDRSPILVLTGQGDSQRLHKESHQIMDVVGMFKPVTKWGQTIRHPNNIPEVVRKAVRLARSEKPGACLIELP